MNAAPATKLEDLRFPSRKAANDALKAVGAKPEGRAWRWRSVLVTVYKRGTDRYALSNIGALEQWYAETAGASILADYAAGNVRVVHAG